MSHRWRAYLKIGSSVGQTRRSISSRFRLDFEPEGSSDIHGEGIKLIESNRFILDRGGNSIEAMRKKKKKKNGTIKVAWTADDSTRADRAWKIAAGTSRIDGCVLFEAPINEDRGDVYPRWHDAKWHEYTIRTRILGIRVHESLSSSPDEWIGRPSRSRCRARRSTSRWNIVIRRKCDWAQGHPPPDFCPDVFLSDPMPTTFLLRIRFRKSSDLPTNFNPSLVINTREIKRYV